MDVDAVEQSSVKITEVSLVSDVDRDIPRVNSTNENRYALIIGNEDYNTYQHGSNTEENVVYAGMMLRFLKIIAFKHSVFLKKTLIIYRMQQLQLWSKELTK